MEDRKDLIMSLRLVQNTKLFFFCSEDLGEISLELEERQSNFKACFANNN